MLSYRVFHYKNVVKNCSIYGRKLDMFDYSHTADRVVRTLDKTIPVYFACIPNIICGYIWICENSDSSWQGQKTALISENAITRQTDEDTSKFTCDVIMVPITTRVANRVSSSFKNVPKTLVYIVARFLLAYYTFHLWKQYTTESTDIIFRFPDIGEWGWWWWWHFLNLESLKEASFNLPNATAIPRFVGFVK